MIYFTISRHYMIRLPNLRRLMFASSTSLRVDLRLQEMCIRTEMPLSQGRLGAGASASDQSQTLENLIRQILDREQQRTHGLKSLPDPNPLLSLNTSSKMSITEIDTEEDLEHEYGTVQPRSPPFRSIQLQLAFTRHCDQRCRCSCHKPCHVQSPSILNRVLGSLLIGYYAIPTLVAGSCDTLSCLNRSAATINAIYTFPYWFLCRAISLNVAFYQG